MFGVVADMSLRIAAGAAMVGLVLTVLRVRSGAARHAAWAAVLSAMLMMPVLTAIVPPLTVTVPATLTFDGMSRADPIDVSGAVAASRSPSTGSQSSVPVSQAAAGGEAIPSVRVNWRLAAIAVYLAGAIGLGLQFLVGWRRAGRLIAGATRLDVVNRFPVLASRAVATPVTTGIFSAAVLLPVTWRQWPAETLSTVLAHENAHIVRRDSLVAAVARINRALFWFHPLAWWLERTLAVTAEHACDEVALRAVGDSRRYAGLLLDMAAIVRRHGGRVEWPAIGVGGSARLDARIDRILRGDGIRPTSRAQRLVTGVACFAALVFAIACRQQLAASPLREDPALAARLAAEPVATKRFEASRDMTPADADTLEARIAQNPDDWDARERLVTYYRMGRAVPWEKKVPGLRHHALWLIEHHPEHDVQAPPLSPEYDPKGFAAAVRLWDAHLARKDASPFLVHRAAQFFAAYDKPRAEQLIVRGLSLDPQSLALKARMPAHVGAYEWPTQLAFLYGAAVIGAQEPWFRRFDAARARSPYAMAVRSRLAESTDAPLLARVGSYVVGSQPDPEIKAFGAGYLERARQLQPDLMAARTALIGMRVRDRHERIASARRQGTPINEADRLASLAEQAQHAYMAADRAAYYKKDEAAARASRAEAVAFAQEALRLAAGRRDDPTYSSSVATAHFLLANSAARDGDRDRAISHLREAATVPVSEEVAYYPMGFWLAPINTLLKAGERERVVGFLESYARVNRIEHDRLLEDARNIREGRMPAAYQFMVTREASSR